MGRSGRVAPRICSTLEIRTHATSSSSSSSPSAMALTVPPPPLSSTVVALSSKTVCSPPPHPAPPVFPNTPGQTVPANVKQPQQPAWPLELLQLMHQQVEVLNSHNSNSNRGGVGGCGEPGGVTKQKHYHCAAEAAADDQDDEAPEEADAAAGNDVELHAQSPLPEDWEQFLDLKTHELYYLHVSSCKRAKRDPRELVRQADESVRALVLRAQARFAPKAADSSDFETASSSSDVDTCAGLSASSEMTDRACLEAISSQVANGENGEMESTADSNTKRNKIECDDKEECSGREGREGTTTTGMVALGCSHCSMFVMLSLSSPWCPSCGETTSLHTDHDKDG